MLLIAFDQEMYGFSILKHLLVHLTGACAQLQYEE